MSGKQTMEGVKAGGSAEQRANNAADQSMKQVEAAGDVRQLIEIASSEMDVVRRELPKLRAAVNDYDSTAQKVLYQLDQAQAAAKENKPDQVVASLKGLGRWVADLATKVGTVVLAKLIEGQVSIS